MGTVAAWMKGGSNCQLTKFENLVEAAGVEPASEKARYAKTTCVSDPVGSAVL